MEKSQTIQRKPKQVFHGLQNSERIIKDYISLDLIIKSYIREGRRLPLSLYKDFGLYSSNAKRMENS
jgi:hypothetical protein